MLLFDQFENLKTNLVKVKMNINESNGNLNVFYDEIFVFYICAFTGQIHPAHIDTENQIELIKKNIEMGDNDSIGIVY